MSLISWEHLVKLVNSCSQGHNSGLHLAKFIYCMWSSFLRMKKLGLNLILTKVNRVYDCSCSAESELIERVFISMWNVGLVECLAASFSLAKQHALFTLFMLSCHFYILCSIITLFIILFFLLQIVPFRLRFKCRTRVGEMDSLHHASQTRNSTCLKDAISNDSIWYGSWTN